MRRMDDTCTKVSFRLRVCPRVQGGKPWSLWLTWTLLALTALLEGQGAGQSFSMEKKDGGHGGDAAWPKADFHTASTDHFVVRYNTSDEVVRPLLDRLEEVYREVDRLGRAMDLSVHPPSAPLSVFFFDQPVQMRAYCVAQGLDPATTAGFYEPRTNVTLLANTRNRPEVRPVHEEIRRLQSQIAALSNQGEGGGDGDPPRASLIRRLSILQSQRDQLAEMFNRLVIRHEAAHQILFNTGVLVRGADNPAWLVEGLACQFEIPQKITNVASLRVNSLRLLDLRGALDLAPFATHDSTEQWEKALRMRRLSALGPLIASPSLSAGKEPGLAVRYAQSWGLVFYLIREHPEAFRSYCLKLRLRKPGAKSRPKREREAFEAAFGPVTADFHRRAFAYLVAHRSRSETTKE